MIYEWDDNKNKSNLIKHGVSFDTAQMVFNDPLALSIQDVNHHHEERWKTLGLINGVVILLVVHTYQEQDGTEIIRIISARKATKKERQSYDKNK